MLSRIKALQTHISSGQAFLLANPADIYYYTGFEWLVPAEREAFFLITSQNAYLFYASFSPVSKSEEITLYAGCYPNQVISHITTILKNDSFSHMLVDAESMYVSEYQSLQTITELTFGNLDRQLIWNQRMIKDATELECIDKAVAISLEAYEALIPQLSIGMTERDVKRILEQFCQDKGADTMAFPTIVAFGPNSALPHYQPADVRLKENMAILLDFGAKYKNYCADITRTLWFGPTPDPTFTKIESVVKEAYDASLALISTQTQCTAQQIDTAAREVIDNQGYGSYFIHTTGHGLGIDIHEQPSLNWKNTQSIQKNMVITIEPGIYLEDRFGYRYENTVIVNS